jgi:hypothetical protein
VADNTVLNTGSGGDTIATDDIGGVKHQRVKVEFGADGSATDVSTSNPLPVNVVDDTNVYRWVLPVAAVGANKVYGDLFNATGSGKTIRVQSAFAFAANDVAVTGTLGVRLHLTRTTSVGTGGTTIATDETSLTLGTIAKLDPSLASLPAQITARAAPTGGAAGGAHITMRHVFTEETNAASALAGIAGAEFVRLNGADLLVPENTGIRWVQGTVASVGNVHFEVTFELI